MIEPILVLNLVRARSSWLGLGVEPSADRSPNRRRIVCRGPYENNRHLLNACLHLLIIYLIEMFNFRNSNGPDVRISNVRLTAIERTKESLGKL